MARRAANEFYRALKENLRQFNGREVADLFRQVSEERVEALAEALSAYIGQNLPRAFENRDGLGDYRTNPYVLLTSASVMNLDDPEAFANFLFNTKMYMALETSFGKSIEAALVQPYPMHSELKWEDPPEKIAEFDALAGLTREERAHRRKESVWREIDKSVVVGNCRYLTSIKSGPNTINDSQVQAMTQAIIDNHEEWFRQSRESNPAITELHIVLGLTYGTDRSTNNKENQILVKLLDRGFIEEDRAARPGVLVDADSRGIRVYRVIGQDFWSFIGSPGNPGLAQFAFLEILLSLAKALSTGIERTGIEARINTKIRALAAALSQLQFERRSLPEWVREDFSEDELFWFATSVSAFYDHGI